MTERRLEQPRVLVVDDNAANRELATATLEDESMVVLAVQDGAGAVEAVRQWRPDCVVLDVRMPGMDGFEVCRRIRETSDGEHVPILFLTALRDLDTFDTAVQCGADDFLTKPVRPAELVLRVQTALKVRSVRSELREQYELIKRQRDDLRRLQLQKERLSAFLVHDLKNPINTMDLWAQQALRDPALSDRARVALRRIREETSSLTRMVLNLLDISRSEEGALFPRLQPVHLTTLIDSVVDELEIGANANQVVLRQHVEPGTIEGDPDLLRRVFANLLDNAVRHSPEGGTVIIEARPVGDAIRIAISDEGPGIPEAARECIFEPYVQLASSTSLRSGRGLGLTFCKLALEAHRGRVGLEASERGAMFVVTLPLSQQSTGVQ